MSAPLHRSLAVLAAGLLAAACAEPPTAAEDIGALSLSKGKGGKSNSCSAYAPLAITLVGDGLTSDGGGVYQEGMDGVEAHINDPTGNLSIWTTQSPRSLQAYPSGHGTVDIDRAYTNNHSNTCGLQLSTLTASTSAVFEGEERSGGTGSTISKVRYGMTCGGQAETASRVSIAWDETTVTLTAPSGNYCKPGNRKNTWVDAGSVAGFSMTMVVP